MKILLDENLPHELRLYLPGHDVFTVAYMRRAGVRNGDLLARAAESGFQALITMDGSAVPTTCPPSPALDCDAPGQIQLDALAQAADSRTAERGGGAQARHCGSNRVVTPGPPRTQ